MVQEVWQGVRSSVEEESRSSRRFLVQSRRDGRAAKRFFRKLLKTQGQGPSRLVTDQLGSYRVAHRGMMPSVRHDTTRRSNHRAEVPHEAVRQRERQMRRFKSARHAQRFLCVHGVVGNLFRVGRQKQIIVSGGLGIPFPGKADRGPISSDRKPVEVVGSSEMVSYSNDDTYR